MSLPRAITGNFHEVWLVDTGHFFVMSKNDLCASSYYWQHQMATRRVLRMYVPDAELGMLAGIDKAFEVTRGAFELIETQRKVRQSFSKRRAALFKAVRDAKTPEQRQAQRQQLLHHLYSEREHLNKALDLTETFARILPSEDDCPIKQTTSYDAVAVITADRAEEERKRKEAEEKKKEKSL